MNTKYLDSTVVRHVTPSGEVKYYIDDAYVSKLEEENKELKRRIAELGNIIHYPDCWDTVAYPTLESVLFEIGCNPDDCLRIVK